MNILLLGSGGREHALAWKITQSPACNNLFIAPGNGGTRQCGKNVAISPLDFNAVSRFALEKNINMVVVGPEDPLVKGIHDYFIADQQLKRIPVIGPVQKAAMLEGSKDFAKGFMTRHNIPTAEYQTFKKENLLQAKRFLERLNPPYVIKADGLAAGKGVLIISEYRDACKELEIIFSGKFGSAGERVVIEQFLKGTELSVFVATDGNHYCVLPEAKDYKRIGEGDTGPNTGGMGAVSGVPFADASFMGKVEKQIIIPTIEGLIKENILYTGFIFFGLMKVNDDPYVIEYNARLGDPETESILPRIKTDFVHILNCLATQNLAGVNIETDKRCTASIMVVSDGYPGPYEKGKIISGWEDISDGLVFHAGTQYDDEGQRYITSGGRVLAITAYGSTLEESIRSAGENALKIKFEGARFRKDIGFNL